MTGARLAGFATRVLGFAIDCLILDVAAIATGAALTWGAGLVGIEFGSSAVVVAGLAAGGWLLLFSVYLVTFWAFAGQTPGMRFMGIRVTDRRGARPGIVRCLRRLGGTYLAALPLGAGFLLVLVDDERRGLQDRVARTLVIHDVRRPRAAAEPAERPMAVGTPAP